MKTNNAKALKSAPMFREETLWGKVRGYVIPVLSLFFFVLFWEIFARSSGLQARMASVRSGASLSGRRIPRR